MVRVPLPPGGGEGFCRFLLGRFLAAFLGGFQAVAFSVGLQDVHPVGEAVEKGSGEAFVAKDLSPTLEGQVGGEQYALPFVGAAEHLEEEFGAGFRKGDIAEFVEDEQVEFLQPLEQPGKLPVFAGFEELGDQGGDGVEAHALSLGTGGMAQGRGQVGLAGAGITHEQNVLPAVEVFAAHELEHEVFVDAGLGLEVEGVQGFEDGELGRFDAPERGALFPVDQLAFAQAQEEGAVVQVFLGAGLGDALVFPQDGGQLELLEVVLKEHGGFLVGHQLSPPSSTA